MELITSHINADFDALASMIAARKLYPNAVITFPGSQERQVRDFIEVFNPVEIRRIRDIDLSDVTHLIIVDTKRPDRIGPLAVLLEREDLKVHIYDHHPFEVGDIRGEVEKIEEIGATATMFTELLKDNKLDPSPMEATILALGIYEETGSLLFPSTTERDLFAVAYLIKRGANLNIVSSYLKMNLNVQELDLLNELVKSASEIVVKGIKISIASASRESYVGDAAHLAHRMMDMADIDAVFVLLNMEGKILIVGRSRVPELDVAGLLKEFGGGGHPTAASATIKEASVEVVADKVRQLLDLHVKPGKTAADIMTSPVITIPWDSSIKEAGETMTRYGVNVLPVVKEGAYLGLISRETVEKALFHGFRKNKCIEFAAADVAPVDTSAMIRDIEKTMIEQNQRFMPVVSGSGIVGAITRTDLLRVMYEEFLRKRHLDQEDTTGRTPPGRNLSTWLRERFPSGIYEVLKRSGEIADSMGYNAFLVGGSVRDLLLGQENLDIDIVIEGDGILFARELGAQMGAVVKTHQRFGTARIILDWTKLDIATARTEYYESPAALPTVETSSIKKDLYRRDFTINTLAIKLNPGDFGLLIDFFGGQRDLREKTIRVLHNLSFIEDPTRAFRAVRFAERFGFKLSRHTENLVRSALQMDLFDRLSGSRLYDELVLSFKETNPVRTLKRLDDYGLLKAIHPDISLGGKLEASLSSLYETLAWYNLLYLEDTVDTAFLYLMLLLAPLDESGRKDALARLSAPPPVCSVILKGIPLASDLAASLPLNDPADIYHLLAGVDLEIILFAMALTKDKRKKKEISLFLVELRKVRPLLKGRDLKELGVPEGPAFSRILKELLDERLRGRLKTKEDERRFVAGRLGLHDS